MAWEDLVIIRPRTVYEPFGVFSVPPEIAALEKWKAFITGASVSGKLTYKDVDTILTPNTRYELIGDKITSTPLAEGNKFKIVDAKGDFDNYLFTGGILTKTSGAVWIEGRSVAVRPAITAMTQGITYFVAGNIANSTIAGRTWNLSEDGLSIVEGVLKSGQFIFDPVTYQQFVFDGYSLKNITYPFVTSFYAEKNVKIYEDDGTPRAIPRQELFDTYSTEEGLSPTGFFATGQLNHSVLLANQTDATERWVYIFTSSPNSATFEWHREPPTRSGPFAILNGFPTVEVQRGDKKGVYRVWTSTPFINPNGVRQIRAFQAVKADNTPVYWKLEDPGETARLELEKRIQANKEAIAAQNAEIEALKKAEEADTTALEESVTELSTTVASLPTNDTLTPIKDDVKDLQDDYAALDKSKASQASVDAVDTAVKAVATALDKLSKLPPDVTQEELDAAITAYKAADTAAKAALDAAKASVEAEIDKTVIEWQNVGYRANRIVVRQNAFFKCVTAHTTGIDPLTDKSGSWIKFPEEGNAVNSNRSPLNTDIYPEGTTWNDLSFGATTPLRFLTTGGGLWLPLNQITLTRVRFDLYGTGSTYQSRLSSIKFYKADGTEISNSAWIWGARSGLGGQSAGTAYTGQNISAQYNASGTCDLEPSSAFNFSESISKVTGSTAYVTVRSVTFFYSNGGSKTFSPSSGNLATCDPAIKSRYGDNTISAKGEILTSAKLTNPDSVDPGQVTGQAFVSAVRTVIQSIGAKQEIIRSDKDPDYTQEWETWRKVATDLTAWTITVIEYARTSQDTSMPMVVRTESLAPPTHETARTNAQGEFVAALPNGAEFVYSASRNGHSNYFTFPANVYKEVGTYYVFADDSVVPRTTTIQTIAAGSTSLGVGSIMVSSDVVALIVEFYKLDNSKITYRIPLSN